MFGFLAALGPVGLAAAVVGTAATVVMASSSSSGGGSGKNSNRREVENEYKEDKTERIKADIDDYIEVQTQYIKQKYNVDIVINDPADLLFSNISRLITKDKNSINDSLIHIVEQDTALEIAIKKLENDISDTETAIDLLKGEKSEVVS